jgi:hypothetical protein
MKWIDLDLSKVAEIEKQIGEVIRTFEALSKQLSTPRKGVNTGQVTQALRVLKAAIVSRIVALETFYKENDLDSRAARFEAARLKLKRALKESGMAPQEFASIAAAHLPGHLHTTGLSGETVAADGSHSSSARDTLMQLKSAAERSGSGQPITLRVHMTPAEFEELRARRQAIMTVRRGQGRMSWETAATRSPRADPAAQGMYTYHEIPYEDKPTTPRRGEAGTGMKFGGAAPLTPRQSSSLLNKGPAPYVSTNADVFARTSRFATAADEWRGGSKAVDTAKPFNPVVSRTNVSSALAKVRSFGGS